MRRTRSSWSNRIPIISASAAMMMVMLGSAILFAHENHAPLPTKGVTIAGNNVLLSEKAREAIGLTTEKVTFANLYRTIEVNARVELPWKQQAMITSLVPGKIDQVLVRPGESVRAGQELARVVSMDLEAIQLAMLQAASDVKLAKQLVEQRKSLDASGAIAGKSLLEAESNLAQKTAKLRIEEEKFRALGMSEAAIQQVLASGQPMPFVSITSPISGIITHADARIGQVVKTTDHLYHVVDPSRVWIVGEVLESDVRHLKKGQPVAASFAALPQKQFEGVIDHVHMKMDPQRRTQSVVIAVDNPEGLLRPGMFGRVSIGIQVAKEAIVCPADAVNKSRTGDYVLVQRVPGKYENRLIKIGLAKKDQVEVLDGVFPGDQVVVVGSYLLSSLLGNEHKARVSGSKTQGEETNKSGQPQITVANATVELPTNQQAYAGPRVEGRIHRVYVEPSQHVKAGQVLAEIDCLELRTVQLDLLQACSQLRLIDQSLARLEKLAERNITPQRRIWELKNQQETLRQEIGSLKRKLTFFGLTEKEIAGLEQIDLARQDTMANLLSGVPVRAPISGWLVGFHVVPGQIAHPEEPLFEIQDLSKVWVKGFVFERDAARVKVGQTARVTFSAFPNLEAIGRVVRIAPTMHDTEQVLPVWIEVANPDLLLKEGMLARVAILPDVPADEATSDDTAQLHLIKPLR